MRFLAPLLALGLVACSDGGLLYKVPTSPDTNCDGIDNDLNGKVDDGYVSTGTCGTDLGICTFGSMRCIKGQEVCSGGFRPWKSPDVCDGRDTDCDGEVDEDHEIVFCEGEPLPPPCHPGVAQCLNGKVECYGRVDPLPMEICNGVDDDCNGAIDDLPPATLPPVVDLVFMFDMSGSNGERLPWQTSAVEAWIQSLPPDWEYEYWLIEVSGIDYAAEWGPNPIAHTSTVAPVPPAHDLFAGFASLPSRDSGGIERYYDALAAMATEIQWRPLSDRIIVAFFDENNTDSRITEEEAAMALRNAGVKPVIFAGAQIRFRVLIQETGGSLLPLDFNGTNIEDKLRLHAVPPCQE